MLESGAATVERDRRGDPRRRLPDGPVRADGPRPASTSTSPRRRGIWEGLGRPRPAAVRRRSRSGLVADGHLGRKTRPGFYRYDDGRRASARGTSLPSRDPTRRRASSAAASRSSTSADPRRDRATEARPGLRAERRRSARRACHRPRGLRLGAGHPRRTRFESALDALPRPRPTRRRYNRAMTRDLHRPLREAWIVEAVRTPIGRYGGALAGVRPDDLAAAVLRAVVDRAGDRPGARRGRHPRLREPGRRGQPQRRPDGAAARRTSRSRSAG